MNRRGLLALVHCAKKELGLDDVAYRDVLEAMTGHRSAANCSDGQLGLVVDRFKQRGWLPKGGGKQSKNPQARKIWAQWGDLERSGALRAPGRKSLRLFCKRLVGVEDPDWLTSAQAHTVIESLKTWQERVKRATKADNA